MSALLDVKGFHSSIPEIQQASELAPLATETEARQRRMLEFWNCERESFYARLWTSAQEIEDWKLHKLSALVDFAFLTSPFYHELYGKAGFSAGSIRSLKDFEKLPCISKDDLIAGFPVGLPSTLVDFDQCRWMSSSGSSGKKVQIILPQRRADLDTLLKYRMFEFMGGFRLDRNRWLYNIHFCLWWHTSFLGQLPVFSIRQDCSAEKVFKHLEYLQPQVVSSVGSYLEQLASLGRSLQSLGVKVVSTNSETTSLQERQRWSEIFQVPVLDEYSSEELDLLAMECPFRSYHVVEDDSHVEIVDLDEHGIGEVVGTDLWNDAMPIIRYRQGDLAEWNNDSEPCACGSHFRRIRNLHGRADQAFLSKSGAVIPPGSLLDLVEHAFCNDDSNIAQFRVIQESLEEVSVLAVLKNSHEAIPSRLQNDFRTRLFSLLGHEVQIGYQILKSLPEEKSYKRRSLISRVGEQG